MRLKDATVLMGTQCSAFAVCRVHMNLGWACGMSLRTCTGMSTRMSMSTRGWGWGAGLGRTSECTTGRQSTRSEGGDGNTNERTNTPCVHPSQLAHKNPFSCMNDVHRSSSLPCLDASPRLTSSFGGAKCDDDDC